MDKYEEKGRFSPLAKQCFVTAGICLNIIGQGCTVGYAAILLPQLHGPRAIMTLSPEEESWITSVSAFPMLVGNFMMPSLMDRLGRRAANIAVLVIAMLSWIVSIISANFSVLLLSRILQGLSFGMLLPLRSALIGEYTSPKYRGAFLTTISISQAFGIFFVHLIGALMSWQQTALVCLFFPFISLVMTLYSPESPSYLAAKGQHEKCRSVFRWLRGHDEEEELEEMILTRIAMDKQEKENDLKEMLVTVKKKEFYKPILLMIHAYAIMNFSGGPIFASYGTILIGDLLGPTADANFWMIFLDAQRIISNAAAIYFIHRWKRRTVFISITITCIMIQLIISGYVYGRTNAWFSYNAMWLPVIFINLQYFTVATGMVPLPLVIAGEVFPLQYRSIGGSISVVSVAVFTFAVLKTFLSLRASVGLPGTYLVYCGAMTYCLIVIWMLLPETKGKTLQQIEDEFRGKPLRPEEAAVREVLNKDARKQSVISAHSMVVDI